MSGLGATERTVFRCPLCSFESPSCRLQLNHLRIVHSSDPSFTVQCGIGGCAFTARKFSSLYSHIYRKHPESGLIGKRGSSMDSQDVNSAASSAPIQEASSTSQDTGYDLSAFRGDIDYLLNIDTEEQQLSAAKFLLKLKEHRQISQTAIDDIVEGWDGIFVHSVQRLKARVCDKLAASGIDPDSVDGLDDVFSELPHPFEGLNTVYRQDTFYREKMGLIEPEEVKVGEPYHVTRFSGAKRKLVQTSDTYQYVPVLKSLCNLLGDATVIDQIEQCAHRIHVDGTLEDFCDGSLFKNHALFSADPLALQIISFYDELELCNPLGSHVKKHKLGIVLFTLGNIHPKFRSTLKVIYLVLAATAPVIERNGLDAILCRYIEDLKVLATKGITVVVNDEERTFKGALLAFLADNLASHALGGFKESFSFAYRICRTCLASKDTFREKFESKHFVPRSDDVHKGNCALLLGPMGDHYSKVYGINRRSCLIDVPFFSLFGGGLPHDLMHDVLKGVLLHEMTLLLRYCIHESFFSLCDYNEALERFDYDYTEIEKPPLIANNSFLKEHGPKLRLSASQSLLLARILPLLIGLKVPYDNKKWQCFLKLLKIVDIILCPVTTTGLCGTLQVLINEHHCEFVALYTEDALIPKFHYLIHYPDQIFKIGPMIRSWTMRHEAKLNFFKRASRLGNFKNIALSLAFRHQRLLCYEMTSGKLLDVPIECGPCPNPLPLSNEPEHIQISVKTVIPEISDETFVAQPQWVKKNGLTFKKSKNCFVIIDSDGLNPLFGRVDNLLVVGGICVLKVSHFYTDYFDNHLHAYIVKPSSSTSYICSDDIKANCILHVHVCDGLMCIYMKHYFFV